jgi:hypothetical protein
MLPVFPDRKPLEPADRPAIERITRRFEPYSDFAFGSLWAWDVEGTCRVSTLHGNLVVLLKDYVADEHVFSFIGDHRVVETAATLLTRARAEGIAAELRLIPAPVVAGDHRLQASFAVAADPGNHDYVCSIRAWAGLAGHGFAAHRTKISRCRRRHPLGTRDLDLRDPATQAAILALFDRWAETAALDVADRRLERCALQRLFLPGIVAGIAGRGLHEDGQLRAFSLWEAAGSPRGRFSIHHFMKADRAFPGASSLLIHLRSCRLLAEGYAYANLEQDLGIPGLAAFKRSLRPCRYLRKYVISGS